MAKPMKRKGWIVANAIDLSFIFNEKLTWNQIRRRLFIVSLLSRFSNKVIATGVKRLVAKPSTAETEPEIKKSFWAKIKQKVKKDQ